MILPSAGPMGETMAVMMVMGNANLFPRLLGKSESIASVIALEMGTAVYGSTHYHALYAAGMVLMLLLFLINGLLGLTAAGWRGRRYEMDRNLYENMGVCRHQRCLCSGPVSFWIRFFPGGRDHQRGIFDGGPQRTGAGRRRGDLACHYRKPVLYRNGHGSRFCSGGSLSPLSGVLLQEPEALPGHTPGDPVYFRDPVHCAGAFAYSFLVRDLNLGRCIFSAGVALAVMILPFIEVRAEKAFREVPAELVRSSYSLGCSKLYTITRIVLPVCRGELVSGIILGGCYAMGATAPMIFTGAVAYAAVPDSIFSPAMALPLHLYLLVAQGSTSMDTAYGTAFVMMAMIL